jgi:predicted porin
MTFNKKILAGLVAFAAASSAQAVTVAANDGWELGVSGTINQFITFTNDDNGDDISEIRDGLLPAFINFDVKAPTMNGLDMAAHISYSPATNTLAQGGGTSEQREVYFTVDGSFGQVLAGKALGLYGSNAILNEQTIYGVGWFTGGNGTTTLGGIGLGYDYADWRSQVKWTSNDMNGFKVALAVVDTTGYGVRTAAGPTGPLAVLSSGNYDSDELRYEAQLTYAGDFDNGSFKVWAEGAWQDHELAAGFTGDVQDAQYWALGGKLTVGGFEFVGQYSDAEDTVTAVGGTVASEAEWNQWMVQGGYRFNGTTLVSASYSELQDDSTGVGSDDTADRLTVGVYHDVNANLKLVAEYTQVEHDDSSVLDQDIISLGGFIFF